MPSRTQALIPLDPSCGFRGESRILGGPSPHEHAHGDVELNLASGAARYFFAGRFIDLPPGRLVAFWAALPHRLVAVDPGLRLTWVTVPLPRFLGLGLPGRLVGRLLSGEMLVEDPALSWLGCRAPHWVEDLEGPPEAARAAACEIESWLRRLALPGVARGGGGGAAAGSAAAAERIATWLNQHYRDPLDFLRLGRAVGLNPTYAMTAFKQVTGMTIGGYLAGLRLAHARRLLATSERTVLDIALDSGFGSQARFYVAFKRAFGSSPARLRRSDGE